MKAIKWILVSAVFSLIAACHVQKKNSAAIATATATQVAATSSETAKPLPPDFFIKPAVVTYAPGSEELAAIAKYYKDVTLAQLNEGYALYAQGACVNCHTAKDIHLFEETQWKGIVDDMAKRAVLSDQQKEAVYKYVLAVKATQTKRK